MCKQQLKDDTNPLCLFLKSTLGNFKWNNMNTKNYKNNNNKKIQV